MKSKIYKKLIPAVMAIALVITLGAFVKSGSSVVKANDAIVEGTWIDDITDDDNFLSGPNASEGNGSISNPHIIRNARDLAFLSYYTQSFSSLTNGRYFALGDDIDLAGKNWVPIGRATNAGFKGAIDGRGYKIKNLTILESDYTYTGLIGYSNGLNEYKNIVFESTYITTSTLAQYTAACVGMAKATGDGSVTFENITLTDDCTINSTFPSGGHTAGVVARVEVETGSFNASDITNYATVENVTGDYVGGVVGCLVTSPAQPDNTDINFDNIVNNGKISGRLYAGGIVALTHYANVTNSSNTGDISSPFGSGGDGSSYGTGGLIGRTTYGLYVEDCFNTGTIDGYKAGGLIGRATEVRHDSVIKNSYNIGNVDDADYYAGGLIADYTVNIAAEYIDVLLTIENCYNSGSLYSLRSIGGVAGKVSGDLKLINVRNTANIESAIPDIYAGGLVFLHQNGNLEITQSYNTGDLITSGATYAGGLVGYANNGSAAYQDKLVKVTESYNLGAVEGRDTGGLFGRVNSLIQMQKCFNMGSVTCNLTYGGGLIGYLQIRTTSTIEDLYINKSFNSGDITAGTYIGGLIGRVEFAVNDGASKQLFIQQSLSTATMFQATRVGGLISDTYFASANVPSCNVIFDGSFALNYNDDVNYQLNAYSNRAGDIIVTDNGSRTLSYGEMRDQEIYENAGYDFEYDWAMPAPEGNGNNGAPYLFEIAGVTLTLIEDGGAVREYNAVFCESVLTFAVSKGKTFTGWRAEDNTFFEAGLSIPVLNYDMTLTAEFVPTPYIRVIVEEPGVSSIAAHYYAEYADESLDDFAQGYSNSVQGRFYVQLDPSSPDYDKFEGWQVYKPEQGGSGYWQTFTEKNVKEFVLNLYDLTNFIIPYETYEIEGVYTIVGEIRIRAEKDVRTIVVGSSGADHQNGGDIGTMRITDDSGAAEIVELDGSWLGMTAVDGATLRLEGICPIYDYVPYYRLTYRYYESGVSVSDTIIVDAVNSVAVVQLTAPNADIDRPITLDIRPVFERVVFDVEVIAQTKDVTDYDLSGENTVTNLGDSQLIYGNEPDINLQANGEIGVISQGKIIRKYSFVRFKIFDNDQGDYVVLPNTQGISMAEFAEFLEKYSMGGKVQIIAEYTVFYPFEVEVSAGGDLVLSVTKPDGTAQEGLSSDQLEEFYEKGTVIVIEATSQSHYQFDEFYNESGKLSSENKLTVLMDQPIHVGARFISLSYTITYTAVDHNSDSGSAVEGSSAVITVNDSPTFTDVKIGDVIKVTDVTAPEGYRFHSVEIAGGTVVPLPQNGIEVTQAFLNNFLGQSTIKIRARFIKLYQLSVSIAEGQEDMGSFVVKVSTDGGQTFTETDQRIFDDGTVIQITAAANEHYLFDGYLNVKTTEYEDATNPDIVRLTLRNSRTITVKFKPVIYNIKAEEEIKGKGTLNISKTEAVLGDQIVLMFTPDGADVIKSWKINGVDIKDLDNVTIGQNSVTINITKEWLETYGDNLDTEIVTGMNDTLLILIVSVSVVLPALAIIFVLLFINNMRKKKAIIAELKAAEQTRYQMNTSEYLQDLIEGKNLGEISDEQVKEELKKRRKK